jgi:transcriptional regulator with XRE-family HTH domain
LDDDWKERLSSNIRRLLVQRGWNQSDLARHSGVGTDNISRYLRGKYVPNAKHLGKIADALGVQASDLYREQEPDDYAVEFRMLRDDPSQALIRLNQVMPTEIAVQIVTLVNRARLSENSEIARPDDGSLVPGHR